MFSLFFVQVPFLYGSGVILRQHREIIGTVKRTIMDVFFDETYLRKYMGSKAAGMADGIDFGKALEGVLGNVEVDILLLETLQGVTSPSSLSVVALTFPLLSLPYVFPPS